MKKNKYVFKDSIVLRGGLTYLNTTIDNLMSIAIEDPFWLLEVMKSGEMKNSTLSFSAEFLGFYNDSNPEMINFLIELLFHQSAYVREGAVKSLSYHKAQPKVLKAFSDMIKVEINDYIREFVDDEIDCFLDGEKNR